MRLSRSRAKVREGRGFNAGLAECPLPQAQCLCAYSRHYHLPYAHTRVRTDAQRVGAVLTSYTEQVTGHGSLEVCFLVERG